MRRLATAVLVVFSMVLPACAQRSAGRSGSSGHSASAFHGASSAPRGFSGVRGGYSPGRVAAAPRTYQGAVAGAFRRRPPYPPSYPPPYPGSWRYRRPYLSPYRAVVPYGASGWIAPYYLGFPDGTGDDEASSSANPAGEGYDQQPDDQAPPPWHSIYDQGPVAPVYSNPRPAAENEAAVTLIFKDGRPPEQIHNYLLTRDTLFVGDRHPSEIPVDQLDLVATAKVNHDAGVDFRLPVGSR